MRVDPAFLESVFFICVDEDDGYRRPGGSGFKVGVPSEPGMSFVYLVTARHVIEMPEQSTLWVRFNRTDGGVFDLETQRDQWILSGTADVAAIRMDVPTLIREKVNDRRIHIDSFVDADYRYRTADMVGGAIIDRDHMTDIGPDGIAVQTGDDLFVVGLFTQHYGKSRNIPLARFASISAMPTEPVRMKRFGGTYFEALAYLVECLSWGGISGSPVFWTAPMLDVLEMPGGLVSVPAYKIGLLGLLSGHFGIPQRATTIDSAGDVLDTEDAISTELNAGIAVVTPASEIKELLMSSEFAEERDRLVEKGRRMRAERQVITPDSAAEPSSEDYSRFDFVRDLAKVTPPVAESSEARGKSGQLETD